MAEPGAEDSTLVPSQANKGVQPTANSLRSAPAIGDADTWRWAEIKRVE